MCLEHVRYTVNRQELHRARDQPCFCKQITRSACAPVLDTVRDKTRREPNQSHPGQLDSEDLVPLRWSCLNQHRERTQKGKQNGWKGNASQQRVSSRRVSKSGAAVITDRSKEGMHELPPGLGSSSVPSSGGSER